MTEPITAKEMLRRARAVNDPTAIAYSKDLEFTFGSVRLDDLMVMRIKCDPIPWWYRFKKWVFNMVHT